MWANIKESAFTVLSSRQWNTWRQQYWIFLISNNILSTKERTYKSRYKWVTNGTASLAFRLFLYPFTRTRLHNVIDPPFWRRTDSVIISRVESEVYSYDECHCPSATVSSLVIFSNTLLKRRLSHEVWGCPSELLKTHGHLNMTWRRKTWDFYGR